MLIIEQIGYEIDMCNYGLQFVRFLMKYIVIDA